MHTRIIAGMMLSTLVALGSCANGRSDEKKKLTDQEITKLLIGKWSAEEGDDKGPKVKGLTHYKKDGTLDASGTLTFGEKSLKIELSGTWKVSDGVIIAAVTRTNVPELLKEGTVTKDSVISIDDKLLKYKSEAGKKKVRKRVKE